MEAIENTNYVKNTASQDEVFHASSNIQPPGSEGVTAKPSPHGQKRKTSSNGCTRMMSTSSEDDDFCDCDACLLGFDDTRPGEVIEEPRRKRTPVKQTLIYFKPNLFSRRKILTALPEPTLVRLQKATTFMDVCRCTVISGPIYFLLQDPCILHDQCNCM